MRIIWKDLNKSNLDLKEDLTNAYFYKVDFTNSKFHNITNASFIQCDLTNSDWSVAEFQGVCVTDCTGLNTIKLLPTINAFIHQFTAPIKAGLIPALSHQFMAILFEQYATTLKNKKYQDIFNEMAKDLREHPELCWSDFVKLWGQIKWQDIKHMRLTAIVCKSDPNVYKYWLKYAVPFLKRIYPNELGTTWYDK